MRRIRQDLGFVALKIEGGILPAEFLRKVVALEAKGQSAKDYNLPKGPTLKDEIGRAWRIASAEWHEYQQNRQRKDLDRKKITTDWITTLLKVVLGHEDLREECTDHIGDRAFPISHSSMMGMVPIVVTDHEHGLDKSDSLFGDDGRKRSPHALVQEYLNAKSECLWGLISNGLIVRLLRDNPSLTRPAFIEADLERMFEEQLYADFAAFWLIFHGSRFEARDGQPSSCKMEQWRQEGHETGERALSDLRKGVTIALKELGNGFLQHKENDALRSSLHAGEISPSGFYRELLRLVYRMLFLFTVEERDLVHPKEAGEEARLLYLHGYSMARLRNCALMRRNHDAHVDLWEAFRIAVNNFGIGEKALGLPALGGLFSKEQCPYLDNSTVSNAYLLRAIQALSFFRSGNLLSRVNYRDMDTEELGSVYESLLELHPYIDVERSPWSFGFVGQDNGEATRGSERKLSGSYYTPQALVDELIKSALEPVIDDIKSRNGDNPRDALLRLRVIDPACGSGHFLLAAARRLAVEVARLDAGGDSTDEQLRRHALREVVRHCIYGVDKNPLAVELCRTALWIETVEPGKPLTFLDGHVRCGNSLIGLFSPEVLHAGIPKEAYKTMAGDTDEIAKSICRRNKPSGQVHVVQGNLFDPNSLKEASVLAANLDGMSEDSLSEVERKKQVWEEAQAKVARSGEEARANLFVGAFFAKKTREFSELVPISEDLERISMGLVGRNDVLEYSRKLANEYGFFHWYLAFPEIFGKDNESKGFDVVLGNPPWDKVQPEEQQFFAVLSPDIATADGAKRKKLIDKLAAENKLLHTQWIAYKREIEAQAQFIKTSKQFELANEGRLNTYSLFTERAWHLISERGRSGLVVQSGLATDDSNKELFGKLVKTKALDSFFDFENKLGLFPAVHREQRFCLLTVRGKGWVTAPAKFACWLTSVDDLADQSKMFELDSEAFIRMSPNTGSCPMFRSRMEAELVIEMYKRTGVIRDDHNRRESWPLSFVQFINMTSDSEKFVEAVDAIKDNVHKNMVAVYEGKLTQIYDHRAATFLDNDGKLIDGEKPREITEAEHRDPKVSVFPRYFMRDADFRTFLKELKWNRNWFACFHDIANPNNERTAIFSVVPLSAVGNSIPIIVGDLSAADICCFIAAGNSLAFDFVARRRIGSRHLNFFVLYQLPMPMCSKTEEVVFWSKPQDLKSWVMPRVLELSFTSWDLAPFARDCGYDGPPFRWDSERRLLIRCELDAAYFHLYGIGRDAACYIIDNFGLLKRNEESLFGEYRTKRLILECYDAMALTITSGKKYQSPLIPPVADAIAAH